MIENILEFWRNWILNLKMDLHLGKIMFFGKDDVFREEV